MQRLALLLLLIAVPVLAQQVGSGGVPGAGGGTVASNTVTGQASSTSSMAVYTPSAQGLYSICAGEVVTSAGTTGATLEAIVTYNNGAAGMNTGLGATVVATTVGADSSATRTYTSCQTVLLAASQPISMQYLVGGSPATPPTYTYWYTLTKQN